MSPPERKAEADDWSQCSTQMLWDDKDLLTRALQEVYKAEHTSLFSAVTNRNPEITSFDQV